MTDWRSGCEPQRLRRVGVNTQGEVAMPFNSPGMYRGAIGPRDRTEVRIFDEESGDGG